MRQRFGGRGCATRIGLAGVRFAFDVLGADEVLSYTEVHNQRSIAVMERLGMHRRRDITLPAAVPGMDGVRSAAVFALSAPQRPGDDGVRAARAMETGMEGLAEAITPVG